MNTFGAIGIFGATFLFGLIASASSHTQTSELLNPQPEISVSNSAPPASPSPTSSPSPVKIVFPQDKNLNMETLIYPGSSFTDQKQNQLSLETSDPADKVTNWYQDHLSNLNLNVKSIIRNNLNGNIYNQIDGSNPDLTISITVVHPNSDSKTKININLSYSKQT